METILEKLFDFLVFLIIAVFVAYGFVICLFFTLLISVVVQKVVELIRRRS